MTIQFPDDPDELARVLLKPYVRDGKLCFLQRDIDSDRIIDELAIRPMEDRRTFEISDEQAKKLLIHSLSNRRVAEYADHVAAMNIQNYGPLPPGLRLFASLQLTKRIPKGRQGRKRGDNYERDHWIYIVTDSISRQFSLPICRNDASVDIDPNNGETIFKGKCAIDHVWQAVAPYGGPGCARVVDIYFEMRKFLKSEQALDPKAEIARALLRPVPR